jgi:hypothetical protein
VAILFLVSACATRQGSSASPDELLSSSPLRSAVCVVEPTPGQLPRADVIVDSAALSAGIRDLLDSDPPPTGHVLLSFAFDREGLNARRDVLEHSTRALIADSIQKLAFAARRQVEESDEPWGVRLRLDLTDPVSMRVGRREFCPPVARSTEMETAMSRYSPSGVRYRGGRRERLVQMRAYVNESGFITNATVTRGVLSGSSVEHNIANYLRQFLFQPATLDGRPVGAWVQIPVRVPA